MKIVNWNVEWATSRSQKGHRIREIIMEINPAVICFTESTFGMEPGFGHIITSESDYGYPNLGDDRRKVLLWSKQPWRDVDSVGSSDLPGGRFVSGITQGTRFIGICIPWRDAHVRTGRKDRAIWQDHMQYLAALKPLLYRLRNDPVPTCIIGDFNQRIPRNRQPQKVYQPLKEILNTQWQAATAGILDENGKQLIDHVITNPGLSAKIEKIIPKRSAEDLPLSDHVGIVATLKRS